MRLSLHSLTTLLLVAALPACTATCSVNKGSSSEIPHEHSKPNSGSKPSGKYSGKSKPNSGSTSKPDGASQPDANDPPEPEPTPQASEPDQDEADPTPPAKPGRAKAKPKRADPPSPSRNPDEPAPVEPEPVELEPVEPGRGSESGTAPMQIDSYGTTPKSGGKVAPPPG
jgi:hypothetical protein